MRDNLVETLFSLLTSADHAEAIAGDLIQERQHRGSRWFWWHAFATAVALWASAVARAPLRTLLVAAGGFALFAVPMVAGVAAVSLFPTLFNALVAWSLLAIIWWGGGTHDPPHRVRIVRAPAGNGRRVVATGGVEGSVRPCDQDDRRR